MVIQVGQVNNPAKVASKWQTNKKPLISGVINGRNRCINNYLHYNTMEGKKEQKNDKRRNLSGSARFKKR